MSLANYKRGLSAEFIVKFFLTFKFYRIIKHRYRNHSGEIDLIAIKGKELIFIEVKARKSDSDEVLTYKQQERIKRSALIFIASQQKYQSYDIRFDLIIVKPWTWPKHIKNAW